MRTRRKAHARKQSSARRAAASPRVKRSWPRMEPCVCYIVECADGTFYTGWAVNAEKRLKVHNAGRGARYTSTRRPVRLVYVEPQPDRITAMKRERALKRLTRQGKQALIAGVGQPEPLPSKPARRRAPSTSG